ncbi:hypothetical protein NL676_016950 [Syzygium grande]|nr:hypothetical protein NL676_016950 [Syzygium grande]
MTNLTAMQGQALCLFQCPIYLCIHILIGAVPSPSCTFKMQYSPRDKKFSNIYSSIQKSLIRTFGIEWILKHLFLDILRCSGSSSLLILMGCHELLELSFSI